MKKTTFPGRAFTAEDVIWEERSDNSWISSHRILNSGVQSGYWQYWQYWQYGLPGSRMSVSRNIALCLVRDAFVVEEWATSNRWAN